MPRIVVLATGTEVGKTYFTCALAAALARDCAASTITAIKPVESGVPASSAPNQAVQPPTPATPRPPTDAACLAAASRPALVPPKHAYGLHHPVSPHLAARLAGQSIDVQLVKKWVSDIESDRLAVHIASQRHTIHRMLAGFQHWLLVETAGGTFTPLGDGQNNFSLAVALEPALWILVAPDKLGVLSDLTATLHAMRASGRAPDMVVLSEPASTDASTGTNAQELATLGIVTPSAVLRRGGTLSTSFVEKLKDLACEDRQ